VPGEPSAALGHPDPVNFRPELGLRSRVRPEFRLDRRVCRGRFGRLLAIFPPHAERSQYDQRHRERTEVSEIDALSLVVFPESDR
jgi:hypothetical protein